MCLKVHCHDRQGSRAISDRAQRRKKKVGLTKNCSALLCSHSISCRMDTIVARVKAEIHPLCRPTIAAFEDIVLLLSLPYSSTCSTLLPSASTSLGSLAGKSKARVRLASAASLLCLVSLSFVVCFFVAVLVFLIHVGASPANMPLS